MRRFNLHIDTTAPPGEKKLPQGGFSGSRFGFFGMVTEVHPEDNTVHVRMDTGRELSGLRVASLEWVTIDDEKDFLSGQRRLPPVNTFVFCITPDGDPARGLVLCSVFGFQVAEHADFKEDTEDAKHIRKQVTNSGWVFTEDNRTKTKVIQNRPDDKNPTIRMLIDYGGEEPLDPPEMHGYFFHDEENDDPGIKMDFVSGDTIDLSVFKDIVLHHKKEEVITGKIFEETNFEYNKKEGFIKGDIFEEEANFEYKKNESITADFFEKEVELSYIKGDTISGKFFQGESSYTHKKGDSVVFKAFDTEIKIKKGLMEVNHKGDYVENISGNKTITVGKNIITKAGGNVNTNAGGSINNTAASVNDN